MVVPAPGMATMEVTGLAGPTTALDMDSDPTTRKFEEIFPFRSPNLS